MLQGVKDGGTFRAVVLEGGVNETSVRESQNSRRRNRGVPADGAAPERRNRSARKRSGAASQARVNSIRGLRLGPSK